MKRFLFILGLLSLFPLSAQVKFTGKNAFTLETVRQKSCDGKIFVIEKDKGELPLTCRADGNKLTVGNDDFCWDMTIRQVQRLDRISGTIRNISKRQLLLEIGMKLNVPRKKNDFFWGGFDVQDAGNKPLKRLGFKGKTSKHLAGGLCVPFPVSTLISSDQAFILGGRQNEITSYTVSVYEPGKNSAVLNYSQRIVLEAGEELKTTFFCGSVPVRFDREQNVVEAFYEASPEEFSPFVSKKNPYLRGTYSQYTAWSNPPDYERERRRYATLDWAYTPFKRSGDWFGRPEYWDYKPMKRPFQIGFGQLCVGENFDYRKLSCDEFHLKRKSVFDRMGRKFGFSFYICTVWCEKQLAESIYKDSIITDPDVTKEIWGWCTGHDTEIRVFPVGGSFGKAIKRDIKALVDELDLPGFAADCGTPGVNFYGAAVQNNEVKGRAWDEKGIFCDELCALNQLFDYIRSLRPSDPLYVWKNGEGKADIRLIETELFSPIFYSWMPLTRYNAGQRPCIMHAKEGYVLGKSIPDWEKLTLDEFLTKWHRLGDHLLLSCFEYGMTQSIYGNSGNAQMMYCMPELLECIYFGWRALIPVAVSGLDKDKMLYRARYGRKENTILFYGNPYENAMPVTFTVDNSGLGGGYQLFLPKMRDFAAMKNRIVKGETVLDCTLPSRKPFLLEAAFSLSSLPESGSFDAVVSSKKDINEITYTAELSNKESFTAAVTPREVEGFTVKLQINGKTVAVGEDLTIPAGAKISATYTSQLFASNRREILAFPFTDKDNHPAFTIILPPDANEAEKKVAELLKDYFRFTGKYKITASGELPAAENSISQVIVTVRPGTDPVVKVEGDKLYLSASDYRQGWQNYIALSRIMDLKYPNIVPMTIHSPTTRKVIGKFGRENLILPWSACFENSREQDK
ncbi:MAG: hypothetical protein E7050_09350 [Lentisphaerae bacterium]|nr:hypothetical protein [Lentisphaerota bacterium]